MKLSELKEHIIKEFGKRGWNELKETSEYFVYSLNKEEQLKVIKEDYQAIKFINKPTEEMQLEAIKSHNFMITEICNPSKNVLLELIKEAEKVTDLKNLIKHIENDSPIINDLNKE